MAGAGRGDLIRWSPGAPTWAGLFSPQPHTTTRAARTASTKAIDGGRPGQCDYFKHAHGTVALLESGNLLRIASTALPPYTTCTCTWNECFGPTPPRAGITLQPRQQGPQLERDRVHRGVEKMPSASTGLSLYAKSPLPHRWSPLLLGIRVRVLVRAPSKTTVNADWVHGN